VNSEKKNNFLEQTWHLLLKSTVIFNFSSSLIWAKNFFWKTINFRRKSNFKEKGLTVQGPPGASELKPITNERAKSKLSNDTLLDISKVEQKNLWRSEVPTFSQNFWIFQKFHNYRSLITTKYPKLIRKYDRKYM